NHNPDQTQLPSMNTLSDELDLSVARLREQIEVAKALGYIDVRPRTGIRRLPYTFTPAVWQSLSYALVISGGAFEAFSDLRRNVEMAYWEQAASLLEKEDHSILNALMQSAWDKLKGTPIRIPHKEHRELHLMIFSRLENPFVFGILEAYWEAYEAIGLGVYADYDYLKDVWNYHQKMVDAICAGDFAAGYEALIEHVDLLYHRPGFSHEESHA
ncbi:MAG: FCD domain-containing protein, partial [Chloroflexota bacterium]